MVKRYAIEADGLFLASVKELTDELNTSRYASGVHTVV